MGLKARKGNRVVEVLTDTDKEFYKAQGYDIVKLDETGKQYEVIESATGGKTYTVVQYNALLDENKKLKLEAQKLQLENQELKQKIQELEKTEEPEGPDREALKKELTDLNVEFASNAPTAKLVELLNEAKG